MTKNSQKPTKETDVRKVEQLRRNRSKVYHEMLNGISMVADNRGTCVFFVTISGLKSLGSVSQAWHEWTTTLFPEIMKNVGKLQGFVWGLGATEEHLGTEWAKEAPEKERLDQTLQGYPHGHFFFVFRGSPLETKVQQLRVFRYELHKLFAQRGLDFDLKDRKGSKSYKTTLVYCLKDQRAQVRNQLYTRKEPTPVICVETVEFEKEIRYYRQQLELLLNTSWVNLVAETKGGFPYQDNFHSFVNFVRVELKTRNLLLYKGDVFQKKHTCTYLLREGSQGIQTLLTLLLEKDDVFSYDFIKKHWSYFEKTYTTTYFLDDVRYNFRYIELVDMIWNVETNTFTEKTPEFVKDVCAFKYIDLTRDQVVGDLGMRCLKSIVLGRVLFGMAGDGEFRKLFYFLNTLGRCVVKNEGFGKEFNHIYLYGASNSGKSLLVERFYIWLYGYHNIGIIGEGNFSLEMILNKRVVIVNEFKFTQKTRSMFLKLLDQSMIHIQRKHEKNLAQIMESLFYFISNFHWDTQGLDEAFANRLTVLEFGKSFEELGLTYKEALEEFPFILYTAIKVYLDYEKVNTDFSQMSLEDQRMFDTNFRIYLKKYQAENLSFTCLKNTVALDNRMIRRVLDRKETTRKLLDPSLVVESQSGVKKSRKRKRKES